MVRTIPRKPPLTSPQDIRSTQIRRILNGEDDAFIIIDDEENIESAVSAGVQIDDVYATPGRASATGEAVTEIAVHLAKKLFGRSKLSRLFAVARRPQRASLDALLRTDADVVVLDGPTLAGNVGAVIRSTLAFGAGAVVLTDSRVDVYDRRLIRSSRGGVFQIPVVSADTVQFLTAIRRSTRPLVMTTPGPGGEHRTRAWRELFCREPALALALGSERRGCSAAIRREATAVAQIPIKSIDSLNLSVAAAILLYERARLRGGGRF